MKLTSYAARVGCRGKVGRRRGPLRQAQQRMLPEPHHAGKRVWTGGRRSCPPMERIFMVTHADWNRRLALTFLALLLSGSRAATSPLFGPAILSPPYRRPQRRRSLATCSNQGTGSGPATRSPITRSPAEPPVAPRRSAAKPAKRPDQRGQRQSGTTIPPGVSNSRVPRD
jgi:hypothetical protein